ncbi:MAG: hypothetical protein QOE70_5973 [Chthoniobacter sp.]|jgi:hypothetical protein|nr:hypothetical protein [Chthoniobacter sp.]
MTSPLLALFGRALREDIRGRATYFARAGLAGFILLVMLGTTLSNQWQGAPGLTFFSIIIWLQAVSITLAGLSYFASAIAEEKEEMTLGLLRMTNLNALSILLGKSTSRLCGALFLLTAQFPFTLLAVTFGGVSVEQVVAGHLALGAYTFFLCNLALFASVIAPRTAGAAVLTLLVLASFFGSAPLLQWVHDGSVARGWLTEDAAVSATLQTIVASLSEASLFTRLRQVLGTGFSGAPAGGQVASNLVLGVGCFLAAWAAFPFFCDRALDGAVAAPDGKRSFLGVRFARPPRPWRDALAWKDFHFLCGGTPGFILRCVGYGTLASLALISSGVIMGPVGGGFFAIASLSSLGSTAFAVEIAVLASRVFRQELREQTLAGLASLPLTLRQMVYAKARGNLLAAVPSAVCAAALLGLQLASMVGPGGPNAFWFMTITSLVSSLIGTAFLGYLVAWLSLLLKRGALPLAFILSQSVAVLVSFVAMAWVFTGGNRWTGSGLGILYGIIPVVTFGLYLGATIVLHRLIFRRLEALAGEN